VAGVRLCQLSKIYPGGLQAVRDVNLQIEDGEIFVLIGPSGCGKTTILRMIAGLEKISSGDIFIDDQRVNDVAPAHRDVAMVLQDPALYPHMSVRQNMAFGLRMRKVARAEIDRRLQNAARVLSLSALLDRRPRELSGGERQRVALGRAIVRDPRVFLFDEPLCNLDANLRAHMRLEIARLHRRLGTTTIYVTHDQAEAMTLGDRIAILRDGVIQQIDTPLDLYRRPANRFVAGFIGSPAMNFIEGHVRDGQFVFGARTLEIGNHLPEGPSILGVRPEDIAIDGRGTPLAEVTLDIVDQLGHETVVYGKLHGREIGVRLPAESGVAVGDQLQLALKPSSWHLFSAEGDQQRIEGGSGRGT